MMTTIMSVCFPTQYKLGKTLVTIEVNKVHISKAYIYVLQKQSTCTYLNQGCMLH